jgi:alpha-L-fucosidase
VWVRYGDDALLIDWTMGLSEGLIPEPSVERLKAVGEWMKVNGESIYGTTASPFAKLAWGRATQKPGKIYLHVFNWPDGQLER